MFFDDAFETHLKSLSTWMLSKQKKWNHQQLHIWQKYTTQAHLLWSSSQQSGLQITQDQMDKDRLGECIEGFGDVFFH